MHENGFAHRDLKPGVSIVLIHIVKSFVTNKICSIRIFSLKQDHRRIGG